MPAEHVGPDDLLEIDVTHCPELSRTFRVSPEGTLALPLLTHPLPASGLTPQELGVSLSRALAEQNLLVDPVVNISVLEYRSRSVSVMGAVVHPVTFQATGRTTLLDAIASAGGLSPSAGGLILLRTLNGSGAAAVQTIAAKDLVGGVESANPMLQGGEEIRIPEGGKIFVAGNVIHPGVFAMQSDTETTVLKAVTLSSGLAPYSGHVAYIYRQEGKSVERAELKVNITRILAHQAPDVVLHADDILYVPASDGKRLASRVLTQLAGFGQMAGGYAIVR